LQKEGLLRAGRDIGKVPKERSEGLRLSSISQKPECVTSALLAILDPASTEAEVVMRVFGEA
jgi:hypothetical protein